MVDYENYQSFTSNDNFLVKVISINITASKTSSDSYNRSYSYSSSLNPSVQYNPLTGIATISNSSIQFNLKEYGNDGSIVRITAVCELLLYNI